MRLETASERNEVKIMALKKLNQFNYFDAEGFFSKLKLITVGKGTVCPVCAEREVLAGYNDLATTDKNLLSDWDYEQNRIQPTEVSRTSAKRAWWKCRHGHSWSMKINERTILGKGCRICEQEYLSVFPAFALSYYSHIKGLKIELGSDRVLGIPLDTYIPSEQVAIEVNSGSEDMEILKEHLCQQRGIKRIKLPMKTNETEIAYAQRIKAAFQGVLRTNVATTV